MVDAVRRLDGHTLYHFPGCAFCGRVEFALRDLNLDVRRANINLDGAERTRLRRGTGKTTVPALRIDSEGDTRWLCESSQIVRYLYRTHGDGRSPPLRTRLTPAHGVLALALVVFSISQMWCSAGP